MKMKSSPLGFVCAVTFGVFAVVLLDNARDAETNVFDWADRPQLSMEQQEMLRLESSILNQRVDYPLRAEEEARLKELRQRLGRKAVRRARPFELILSPTADTNCCTILNPGSENVAFTVSIRGDEEQMGTRKASMGRLIYLPPGGTLVITNLYWTTPGMTRR
jgi:hypothetical protein